MRVMRRSAPGCLALGTLVTLVVGYAPHQDASWAERTLAAQEIERTGSSCSSFDGEILWANDTYFSEHFECTNSEQCAASSGSSALNEYARHACMIASLSSSATPPVDLAVDLAGIRSPPSALLLPTTHQMVE